MVPRWWSSVGVPHNRKTNTTATHVVIVVTYNALQAARLQLCCPSPLPVSISTLRTTYDVSVTLHVVRHHHARARASILDTRGRRAKFNTESIHTCALLCLVPRSPRTPVCAPFVWCRATVSSHWLRDTPRLHPTCLNTTGEGNLTGGPAGGEAKCGSCCLTHTL